MRQGTLASLYRATNAIILGDRLAEKIGARARRQSERAGDRGRAHQRPGRRAVPLRHSRRSTRARPTSWSRPGRSWRSRPGLVNEIRVRVSDPMAAALSRSASSARPATNRCRGRRRNEDLLSAFIIRNIIMYTVVGAILLVASFGTYNIISTITHEKTRDIAIMKSLGLSEAHGSQDLRAGGSGDRPRRRVCRLGARLCSASGARHRSRSAIRSWT